MNSFTRKYAKRREKRKKQTAEIFTPDKLVNEILDKIPEEVWEESEENTFLDPACGNGQFLVHTLYRKLAKGHNPTGALKTIYGVDIKRDNIRECRLRLLKIISLYEAITKDHIRAVYLNVRALNISKYPKGSLDYDMSFKKNYTELIINDWYKKINNGELDKVDMPTECKLL